MTSDNARFAFTFMFRQGDMGDRFELQDFLKSLEIDQQSDFIIIAEFNERIGPNPVRIVPKKVDFPKGFEINGFSVYLLTKDIHNTAGGFKVGSESQCVLQYLHNGHQLFVFAYYFALCDVHARGYMRQFCIAYTTTDRDKIMNNLPSLIYHFGRVVEYLFYGNTILFLDDIKGKMIDLEYTLKKLSAAEQKWKESDKNLFMDCDFTCDVPERDPSVIRVQLDEMDRIKTQVENEMKSSRHKRVMEELKGEPDVFLRPHIPRCATTEGRHDRPTNILTKRRSLSESEMLESSSDNTQHAPTHVLRHDSKRFDRELRTLEALAPETCHIVFELLDNIYSVFSETSLSLSIRKEEQFLGRESTLPPLYFGSKPVLNIVTPNAPPVIAIEEDPPPVTKGNTDPSSLSDDVDGDPSGPFITPKGSPTAFSFHSCSDSDRDHVAMDNRMSGTSSGSCAPDGVDDFSEDDQRLSTSGLQASCNVQHPSLQVEQCDYVINEPTTTPSPPNTPQPSGASTKMAADCVETKMASSPKLLPALNVAKATALESSDSDYKTPVAENPLESVILNDFIEIPKFQSVNRTSGSGILAFCQNTVAIKDILYAVFQGRPFVIAGRDKKMVTHYVQLLSLFVPGRGAGCEVMLWLDRGSQNCSRDLPQPQTVEETPILQSKHILRYKLIGMNSIYRLPPHLQVHLSSWDIDLGKLRTPEYTGKLLNSIIGKVKNRKTDVEFLARIQSVLLEYSMKAFSFYQTLLYQRQLGNEANNLLIKDCDHDIIRYLVEVVMCKQLEVGESAMPPHFSLSFKQVKEFECKAKHSKQLH